jgi:hypothetical protein
MTGGGYWLSADLVLRDRRWRLGDLRFPGAGRSAGAVRAGGVGADGMADACRDRPLRHPGGAADYRGGECHAAARVGAGRGPAWRAAGMRLADRTLDGAQVSHGTSGPRAILNVGALLQVVAMVARLKSAVVSQMRPSVG